MYAKYVCQFEEKNWNFSQRKCSYVYSQVLYSCIYFTTIQQVVNEYYPQEI